MDLLRKMAKEREKTEKQKEREVVEGLGENTGADGPRGQSLAQQALETMRGSLEFLSSTRASNTRRDGRGRILGSTSSSSPAAVAENGTGENVDARDDGDSVDAGDDGDSEVIVMDWRRFEDLLGVNHFFRTLVKCDCPKVWNYLIFGQLEFGVDVTTAYLKAHTNILKRRLSLDHRLEERLRRKLRSNMDNAYEAQLSFRNGFPEMCTAISSRHAARMVLNKSRQLMEKMIHEGTVDEAEGSKIVQLIEVRMKELRNMLGQKGLRLPNLRHTIQSISWLHGVDESVIEKLVAAAKPMLFHDGEIIADHTRDGDHDRSDAEQNFLIVMRGSVEASIEVGHHAKKVFDHLGQGSVFGKHFFLTGLKRPTTYTAKGIVYTYQIPGVVIREIMESDSKGIIEESLWEYETRKIARDLLMTLPQYSSLSEAHLCHVGKTWMSKKIPVKGAGIQQADRLDRRSVMVLVHGWCVSHTSDLVLDLRETSADEFWSISNVDDSKYSDNMMKIFTSRKEAQREQKEQDLQDEREQAEARRAARGIAGEVGGASHNRLHSIHMRSYTSGRQTVESAIGAPSATGLKHHRLTYAAKHTEVPLLRRNLDHHGLRICVNSMLGSQLAASSNPMPNGEILTGLATDTEFTTNPAFSALNSQRTGSVRKAQKLGIIEGVTENDDQVDLRYGELHSAPCLLLPQPGECITCAPGARILITKQKSIQDLGHQNQDPGLVLQDAAAWARGLDSSNFERLLEQCAPKNYPAGSTIRGQGMLETHVRLVLEGTVQLVVRAEGQQVILQERVAGTCLGEVELLCGARRETSLRAKDQVTVLEIPFAALEQGMGAEPRMRDELWHVVGHQIGVDLLQQQDQFKHHTIERLGSYLRTWRVLHVRREQVISLEEPFLLLKGEAHFIEQGKPTRKDVGNENPTRNAGKNHWARVRTSLVSLLACANELR